MQPEILSINKKILVSRAAVDDWYNSVIKEINQRSIDINIPYKQEKLLILVNGEPVKVNIYQPREIFEFKSKVIDMVPGYNKMLLTISKPEKVNRIQRRSFLRLPIMLEMQYSIPGNYDSHKTHTLDISGGGIRFLSSKNYFPGTPIQVEFHIPIDKKDKKIQAVGKVVRTVSLDNGYFHVAIEFTKIPVKDQDTIVRFVLSKSTRV